jgi:site-specific recombinase XerD
VITLTAMFDEFDLTLRAQGRSPKTRTNYRDAVTQLAAFLSDPDVTTVVQGDVERYLVSLEAGGKAPSTVATRFRGLQQFWRYTSDQFEIRNPMAKMKPPKVPERIIPIATENDLRALLKECATKDFEGLRDTALVRLFVDSGCRLGELAAVNVSDIDLVTFGVRVIGKGDRERVAPFQNKTALALRQYLRVRAAHKAAGSTDGLWLGIRGKMTADGISAILERRARAAGFKLHPHMLRHTWAHMCLQGGARESDLMRNAGWRSPEMARRYGKAVEDERAREAHAEHSPGERI